MGLPPTAFARRASHSQLNIANPSTGGQKLIEIDDDKKLRTLYDKRLAAEVDGEEMGDEFKGYVFKILGGQDKQGFSMHQGVLTTDRVKLMMNKGARSAPGRGTHSAAAIAAARGSRPLQSQWLRLEAAFARGGGGGGGCARRCVRASVQRACGG